MFTKDFVITKENAEKVKSPALKKIMLEQYEIRMKKNDKDVIISWDNHTDHSDNPCFCVIGGL